MIIGILGIILVLQRSGLALVPFIIIVIIIISSIDRIMRQQFIANIIFATIIYKYFIVVN